MERCLGVWFRVCRRVRLAVLFLVCSCGVPTVWTQNHSDFLNIDCGATAEHYDVRTNLTWVPDDAYISAGETYAFANASVLPEVVQNVTEMTTLRYFDDPRPKNCFSLPVIPEHSYLLRVTFLYGNYDNKSQIPSFQVAIDATIVDNVTRISEDGAFAEYMYVAQGDVTYLCLLRTSPKFSPIVSGISLKLSTELVDGYNGHFNLYLRQGTIMKTIRRTNFGATKMIRCYTYASKCLTAIGEQSIERAPEDYYDRFWFPEDVDSPSLQNTVSPLQKLSTNSTFVDFVRSARWPPSAVLETGISTSGVITVTMLPIGWIETVNSWYVALYFGELNSSATPSRNLTIQVNGFDDEVILNGTYLTYEGHDFWSSSTIVTPASTVTVAPLAGSQGGAILNAMEFFTRSKPRLDKTIGRDALAIEDVKRNMKLMEWTGDPCLPVPHSWITCGPGSEPQIVAVNLSGYQLENSIPASFGSLIGLTTLILDNNNLSGPLPEWLTSLPSLAILSVRNNNFSGPVPEALLSDKSLIKFAYRPGNSFLTGKGGKLLPSPCDDCEGKSSIPAAIVGIICGVAGLIFIVVIATVAYFRCRVQQEDPQSDDEGASMMKIATSGAAKAYSLAEVKAATNQFNKLLGKGGFGLVFFGKLLDGTEVAVKVADGSSRQGEKEFFNEVDVLSRVHHKNLVALVGYCQGHKPILIYEYMHNGSLFDHLHGNAASANKLDWRTRLRIALNAAQGLEYLHTGCSPSFIHRDVKSNNILLTSKMDAKVADFGLTKLMDATEDTRVMTDVMGTAGYLDPEYYTTQYLSTKSDVYSFGIVLLELITGRMPIDQATLASDKNPHIVHWVRESLQNSDMDSILDPSLVASNPCMEALWKVADIAIRSVEPKGVHRPTMIDVVQELHGALTMEGIQISPSPQHILPSNFLNRCSNSQDESTSHTRPI